MYVGNYCMNKFNDSQIQNLYFSFLSIFRVKPLIKTKVIGNYSVFGCCKAVRIWRKGFHIFLVSGDWLCWNWRSPTLSSPALHWAVAYFSWKKANKSSPGRLEQEDIKTKPVYKRPHILSAFLRRKCIQQLACTEGGQRPTQQDVEGSDGHQLHDAHQVHPGWAEEVRSWRNRWIKVNVNMISPCILKFVWMLMIRI